MKSNHLWMATCLVCLALCCLSCKQKQNLEVSKSEVGFSSAGGMGTVFVDADCDWTVAFNGDHDWYSLSKMSGSKQGVILITVREQTSHYERSATFTISSSNGKTSRTIRIVQQPIEIVNIHNRVWFLHEYERWATNYYDEYIEDSYQHWNYYIDEAFDNWFFYFKPDSTGYQYHTKNGDTVIYSYQYIYYPLGDSLYLNFDTDTTEIEDYHAIIHELTNKDFVFSDEHHDHQFEKLFMANISTRGFEINPKNLMKKRHGYLIETDR